MGDTVFANGRAVCHQGSSGKTAAATPDVCLSPPPAPTGPLPVPYPNTAMASDLKKGSKSVKVESKPAFLANKSVLGTSTGDEAGNQGGGIITHKTKGTAEFTAWSFDVMFEGKEVTRHLDMTTNNGSSLPDNTVPWPYLSKSSQAGGKVNAGPCKGVDEKFKLVPYSQTTGLSQTGHHIIPDRCCSGAGISNYTHGSAPTILVTGKSQHSGTHKLLHEVFDARELAAHADGTGMTYGDAKEWAAESAKGINDGKEPTEKEKDCIKHQLDNYFHERDVNDGTPLTTSGLSGKRVLNTDRPAGFAQSSSARMAGSAFG